MTFVVIGLAFIATVLWAINRHDKDDPDNAIMSFLSNTPLDRIFRFREMLLFGWVLFLWGALSLLRWKS